MNIRNPECWSLDPQAHCLRAVLSPGHSFVLSYQHFHWSEFRAGDEKDTIKLVFSSHEITIQGICLRTIEEAVQRRELSLVEALRPRYRPAAEAHQPFITLITITDESGNPVVPLRDEVSELQAGEEEA